MGHFQRNWPRRLRSAQAEGLVFESQPPHTQVVKTGPGTDTLIAKPSTTGVVSRVCGDGHYKRMPRVIVRVAH